MVLLRVLLLKCPVFAKVRRLVLILEDDAPLEACTDAIGIIVDSHPGQRICPDVISQNQDAIVTVLVLRRSRRHADGMVYVLIALVRLWSPQHPNPCWHHDICS